MGYYSERRTLGRAEGEKFGVARAWHPRIDVSVQHPLGVVAPDGSRFVAVFPEGVGIEGRPREQIVVVQHWFEELRRLVPTN